MIDAEFHKEKLLEFAEKNIRCGLNSKGELVDCFKMDCRDCKWNVEDKFCECELMKWLLAEHKEYPMLTKFQYEFLNRAYEKGMQWLSRDSDCDLMMWASKPEKSKYHWDATDECAVITKIFDDFNFIKWEDTEPWNIKELLENCEVEE